MSNVTYKKVVAVFMMSPRTWGVPDATAQRNIFAVDLYFRQA